MVARVLPTPGTHATTELLNASHSASHTGSFRFHGVDGITTTGRPNRVEDREVAPTPSVDDWTTARDDTGRGSLPRSIAKAWGAQMSDATTVADAREVITGTASGSGMPTLGKSTVSPMTGTSTSGSGAGATVSVLCVWVAGESVVGVGVRVDVRGRGWWCDARRRGNYLVIAVRPVWSGRRRRGRLGRRAISGGLGGGAVPGARVVAVGSGLSRTVGCVALGCVALGCVAVGCVAVGRVAVGSVAAGRGVAPRPGTAGVAVAGVGGG